MRSIKSLVLAVVSLKASEVAQLIQGALQLARANLASDTADLDRACARERRRVGDGPAGEVVHYWDRQRGACGIALRNGEVRSAMMPQFVTCKPCLAKMGAPAEPAKPTEVEVGQRWRVQHCTYRVMRGPDDDGRWETDWGDDSPMWLHAAHILADTYLGMAPAAPVEGPAPALCCDRAKPVTNASGQPRYWLCRVHPGVTFANGERQGPPLPAPDASPVAEPPPEVSPTGKPVWFAAPAAPVREPGELTLAEACEAAKTSHGSVEWTWHGYNGRWEPWPDHMTRWSLEGVAQLASARFRLKPAAPKPGRVFEMFDAERDRVLWTNETVLPFANVIAREALACVRRLGSGHAWLDELVDAAERELLGTEAGK